MRVFVSKRHFLYLHVLFTRFHIRVCVCHACVYMRPEVRGQPLLLFIIILHFCGCDKISRPKATCRSHYLFWCQRDKTPLWPGRKLGVHISIHTQEAESRTGLGTLIGLFQSCASPSKTPLARGSLTSPNTTTDWRNM